MATSSTQSGDRPDTRRRSGARRGLTAVAIIMVVLFVALTGAWLYVAHEIDRRVGDAIAAAATRGTAVECANRDVFGYPFRVGLSCDKVGLDDPARELRVSAGALHTAAQIYRPGHIVAELGSPLTVEAPGRPPMDLSWTLLQASTTVWTDGVQRFDLAADAPAIAFRQQAGNPLPASRADRFELHARQNAADLDVAFSDGALVVSAPDLGDLPPVDVTGDATLNGAAEWLRRGIPGNRLGVALRGRSGTLRSLRLALKGGGVAELAGPFTIADTGLLSGDFKLALEKPDAIAGMVSRLVPAAAGIAGSLAGAVGFAGRQENGRTVIDLTVREGEARVGFLPVGRVPPIGG